MIIENLTNEELVFRANGEVLRLKAGINNIESALSTPEEIKRHFGNYVNVYAGNITMVTEPVVKEDTSDEEENDTNDLQLTAQDNIPNGEDTNKQEGTDNADEVVRETDVNTEGNVGSEVTENVGEDETQPEEVDITTLKRPQLLAKFKELNIEGASNKMSNDLLIKAIQEKLGK